ncbi:MAG: hypothetical protein EKK48_19135 [Candidatus Melainabacteria bacterium]|nr:MAG: hypothetical protein EKK48_19135 [Candidatus Melainabacteria bacterium]
MSVIREFDGNMLEKYGILSPAVPNPNGDRRHIVVSPVSLAGMDHEARLGLLEVACLQGGAMEMLSTERYRQLYIRTTRRSASSRRVHRARA